MAFTSNLERRRLAIPAVGYARRLHRWLRPEGTLFILFMQNDRPNGPPFHCDIGAMRRLFASPAWAWPDAMPARIEHPSGVAEQPAVLRRL